jgi:hypothetical protein
MTHMAFEDSEIYRAVCVEDLATDAIASATQNGSTQRDVSCEKFTDSVVLLVYQRGGYSMREE